MHRRAFCSLVAFAALTAAPTLITAQAGAARTFQARLSTVPIDLTMASTIAGSGSVTGTLKGRTLVLAGKFTGLKTPATVARVHRGPTRGMRGDAIFDLTVTASGPSTSSIRRVRPATIAAIAGESALAISGTHSC